MNDYWDKIYDAETDGRFAYRYNSTHNPYSTLDDRHKAWQEGWDDECVLDQIYESDLKYFELGDLDGNFD